MNGIIVYGSFHGSTKKCAEQLAELTGFSIVDAKTALDIDFSQYDKVVIGSALQGFKVHPDMEKLVDIKGKDFTSAKTYFFQVSVTAKTPKYFQKKLGNIKVAFFGVKIDWNTLTISERIIISVISLICRKSLKNFDNIQDKRIKKLAAEIIA